MALSIAQMRNSSAVGLPERSIRMCLAQKLVAEVRILEREKADLAPARGEDGKPQGPGRIGDPSAVRVAEIDTRLAVLLDEMREHTGTLTVRAIAAGEWRRWADLNPARGTHDDKGKRITDPIDLDVGYGYVNAAALLESLNTFAVEWNGEPLGASEWEFIATKAAPGDLSELCRQVVQIHENVGQIPKSLTPSPATPSGESD